MSSTLYPKEQQIHCMSSLSNAAFGLTFPSTTALQNYMNQVVKDTLSNSTVQSYIGTDWQTVWGPVTYSRNGSGTSVISDNTMLLLYSPSQNLYVVGIAGTNIDSVYDWMDEDFAVNSTTLWTDIMGSGFSISSTYKNAAISQGADTGLSILLSMTSNNQTLLQALGTAIGNGKSGAEVAVAGHSLGGALSPVMGLYLHDIQQFSNNWNSSGNASTVSIWATAGPTPGEENFALYVPYITSQSVSGQASLTYSSKYNTLDVVPQAWQQSTLGAIPQIYEDNIQQPSNSTPTETIMGALAVGAVLNSIDTSSTWAELTMRYTQVLPWTSMQGNFDQPTDDAITEKFKHIYWVLPTSLTKPGYQTYFVNFVRYLAQMRFQHTVAYNSLLGISDFTTELAAIIQQDSPGGQTQAQIQEEAISRAIGVDLSRLNLENHPAVKAQLPKAEAAV